MTNVLFRRKIIVLHEIPVTFFQQEMIGISHEQFAYNQGKSRQYTLTHDQNTYSFPQ
ncbi:MAG: hypothetical protein RBG13Loki_2053 [Promethearchaeota archaeon CR_4]|nr:MAG: hypothetical protein RBG13Loki_2053 [Candidatus Lokiarchaeota archaeon CR_4]